MLNIYTVSFFGHRQVEDALAVEARLEAQVRRLLAEKEYVEFLVAATGNSICWRRRWCGV